MWKEHTGAYFDPSFRGNRREYLFQGTGYYTCKRKRTEKNQGEDADCISGPLFQPESSSAHRKYSDGAFKAFRTLSFEGRTEGRGDPADGAGRH